ncbi:MAG: class I SAM-dependent methyltransferase [Balneolaceae bacterium]
MNIDVSTLKGVSETLLIPLMGRALEHDKPNGILQDPKSVEIFEHLDYDFKKFQNKPSERSFLRTTIRTAIIDQWVQPFLEDNPGMTVVEIGCGLNTRFERLDNGKVTWFDLDVPEVMPVWNRFFDNNPRRRFLPFSAFDEGWMPQIKNESQGPFLFISEASVIYFPEKNIKHLFQSLHQNFQGHHYLFDSATPAFLKALKKSNDALIHCGVNFKWTAEDSEIYKKWIPGLEILKTLDLEKTDHQFSSFYPESFQAGEHGYRLNLVRI